MKTYQSKGMLLTLAIVGCVMAESANAAEEPGLGTVVPEAEMTMFCQNAAAARFEVQLDAITTDPHVGESSWCWARWMVRTMISASTAASNRTEHI